MLSHVILGLLRDGSRRHGYELVTLYRARSGSNVSPGNFYRELARTRQLGWVETVANPPAADARRIPYRITDRGCHAFDEWLSAPLQEDHTLSDWMLFVDRVPADVRDRIFERYRAVLWLRSKTLARTREEALAAGSRGWDPLPTILMRRLKQVSAELEFLSELRDVLSECDRRGITGVAEAVAARPVDEAVGRLRRKTTAR